MVIQVAIAAVMVITEADAGPASGTNADSLGEVHKHRHSGPALRQPSFNWNDTDKCIELLSFEMEVMHILQTMTYH